MTTRKKFGVWASSAVLAILATTLNANATCKKPDGNWFMYNMRVNASSGSVSVNACALSVAAGGSISGNCNGYALSGSTDITNSSGPASGNLTVDGSCDLSGSITVTFPNTTQSVVNITAAHMNGDMATGIANNVDSTNTTITAVRLFTLIRQ